MKLGRNRVKRMVQRERKVIGKCDNWMCCVLSHFSRLQLFVTLWIVAHQAPLSVGFSRQECWSEVPFPPPRDLPPCPHPHQGIKPASVVSAALAMKVFTTRAIWEALPNLCQLWISDKEMILRAGGKVYCMENGWHRRGWAVLLPWSSCLSKKHNCLQIR